MKNILITGVSSGIGYQLVLKFSQNSDHKIIGFSRNKRKLKQLQIETKNNPGKVILEAYDINKSTPGNFKRLLSKNKISSIDVLINNAGLLINKPLLKLTSKDWLSTFQTNVFSLAQITKFAHPYLKKAKSGHIVNISSMGGIPVTDKFPGLSAYSSSKSAVSVLSELMAKEFAEDNIACNCIALGAVGTPMLEKAFPGYHADVSPDEVAEFIAEFALKSHQVCNGKIVPLALSST